MTNSNPRSQVACLLSFALIAMVVGCSQQKENTNNPPSALPTPPSVAVKAPAITLPEQTKGIIYTVSASPNADDNGLAPKAISFSDAKSPARSALDALIRSQDSPLAAGTHILGITIADGLATVDFSDEFKSNFHGSDSQEAQAINSILGTLGQFSTIDHVQILVAGKKIDSLGEHFEISDPLAVIRPNSLRQAKSSGSENHG